MINFKIEPGGVKEVGKGLGISSIPFGVIIEQEWLQRTFFVAILAWSTVSMTRTIWFGFSKKITPQKIIQIKYATDRLFYIFALLWSFIFIISFSANAQSGRSLLLNSIYFFMYYSIVIFLKQIWSKGIAPFTDRKFGTNFICNYIQKDRKRRR